MATSSTPVGVGRAHRPQGRVDGEHVGAQPGPGGQEGDALRRGLQAEEEHALVDLHDLDAPVLAGRRSGGRAGMESRVTNPHTTLRTLPAAQSSPTSGPP